MLPSVTSLAPSLQPGERLWSVKDLVNLLGITQQSISRALSETPTAGRSGCARLYSESQLPERFRDGIEKQRAEAGSRPLMVAHNGRLVPESLKALGLPTLQITEDTCPGLPLNRHQRAIAEARLVVLAEIEARRESWSFRDAALHFLHLEERGELPIDVMRAIQRSMARRVQFELPSLSTLYEWHQAVRKATTLAERLVAVAPKSRSRVSITELEAKILHLYVNNPNKVSLKHCVRQVIRGLQVDFEPIYKRCRGHVKRLDPATLYLGQNRGAARNERLPFTRRDPVARFGQWTGDGHAAKCLVRHPQSGHPFRPEVTVIMDLATRFAVGWSVALSENTLAVADALRHAMSQHGVPLLYYSDNGAGQTNAALDAPVTGILTRLGIEHPKSIPGNAQARGVIERFWRTGLIPLAKSYETYCGHDADSENLRLVKRSIARAQRAAKGQGVHLVDSDLPSLQQFMEDLRRAIDDYNARPHTKLPKVNGRHLSPDQYRQKLIAEAPASLMPIPSADLEEAFRPGMRRTAQRGEVRLFNGIYFHRNLMRVDQQEVTVEYEVHDLSRVWVRDLEGRLVCIAELDGNRTDYFPPSVVERATQERAKRQIARQAQKLEEMLAITNGTMLPGVAFRAPPTITEAERAEIEVELARSAELRAALPAPEDDMARWARWTDLDQRLSAGDALDEDEARFWRSYVDTPEWRSMKRFVENDVL